MRHVFVGAVLCICAMYAGTAMAADAAQESATPLPGQYAVLAGGACMVAAWFARKFGPEWLRSPAGGAVVLLTATVLTSLAEAIQKQGLSWSVLVTATGSAALTFVAMTNTSTAAAPPPSPGGAQ